LPRAGSSGQRGEESLSYERSKRAEAVAKGQQELFQQAETILLDDVGVIPIVWYRGDYVYNDSEIGGFTQTNFGLIIWENVFRKS